MSEWLSWVEAHPGLAGWVQAIGSIAALLIAFSVVFVQHALSERSARRREQKDDLDLMAALSKTAHALHASLLSATTASQTEKYESYGTIAKEMADHDEILQSFPITRMIRLDLAGKYLELKSIAQLSRSAFVPLPGTLIYGTGRERIEENTLRCNAIATEIAAMTVRR